MNKYTYSDYGPSILRLVIGIFFIAAGLGKLFNIEGIKGLLSGLGFPAVTFLAWVVLLAEIICGAAVLFGWKVRLLVWPLIVILAVASVFVVIPTLPDPMAIVNLFFHLTTMAALLSLYLTGPGKIAVEKV